MASIITSLLILAIGICLYFVIRAPAGVDMPNRRLVSRIALAIGIVLPTLIMGLASFVAVPASHFGVVTTFGAVQHEVLGEGPHLVLPISKVNEVYVGLNVAAAKNAEAASRDMQKVHSTLTLNYSVDAAKARELFILNPGLNFADAFVEPAMYEVFKAIVSHYTVEDLILKRQEVSAAIVNALNEKLRPYYMHAQSVQLVDFGFSKAFDAAIEEKVTASQKAATAERNLERAKFEAQARVTQAEGEAKAIAIQSAAVEKQGGIGYVQLQAIAKWNGVLPATMAGGAVPFVNLK